MRSTLREIRKLLSRRRDAWLSSENDIRQIPFMEMLIHNWHLGLTSFGGPAVHFQIFRQRFVDKYKWIDDATYEELFGLCQALSGPASTKMLYAINVMRFGQTIGTAAFFLWSLPMAIAAFGLALGVGQIQSELPGPAYALLSGLNSATVGIIILAAVQLSEKAITDTLTRLLVFLGGAAGMLYNSLWYFPILMAAGGAVALIHDLRWVQRLWRIFRKKAASATNPSQDLSTDIHQLEHQGSERSTTSLRSRNFEQARASEEAQNTRPNSRSSNDEPPPRRVRVNSWKTGLIVISAFFITFIIIMVCRGIYSRENRGFDLFANLYLAGTIIFGGGPVVVPLLRSYIVSPGWVSSRDFLLGLAITQAFPGPNFNFAVYLGALAVKGTNLPPITGAIIGFVAIFTPGMWLCTGFLDLWSSVRKIQAVRAVLRGVHAMAVGLVFTAVYRLFEIGYLDAEVQNGGSLSRDPWWVVIIATTFIGGRHFKLVPPLAILLGAAMGLVWYGVQTA